MPKFEFCIPTVGNAVPASAEWFHEIKYDGYRIRLERDGSSVRLISRGGYNWTKRFPWIAEAALKNRRKRFVIDGEAVILYARTVSLSAQPLSWRTATPQRVQKAMQDDTDAAAGCYCAKRSAQ